VVLDVGGGTGVLKRSVGRGVRHVCLDLEGRQACFDVLLDQQGDVIVAGEDLVVSPVQSMSARGWKVSAVALAHSI